MSSHRTFAAIGFRSRLAVATFVAALGGAPLQPSAANAQTGLTLPPSGDNQKASVTQHIGLVEVRIDYSSPDVHGPNGEDRSGKIWGGLVPWGMQNLGFGTAKESPWRAGANENTVFTVSHDVLVEGKKLAAGRYGLHMAPQPEEWTIIFSKNSTSWGSFFYDPAEDALRVTVKPQPSEYHEWLTYDFIDRKPDQATAALRWERLQVPIKIEVPNVTDLYIANLRNELRSTQGFGWQGWNQAANFLLQSDRNLDEALQWVDAAISRPFVGQENFNTLQTKALILTKLGRKSEADPIIAKLLEMGTETQLNNLGYGFLNQLKDPDRALEVFKKNVTAHPESWNVHDSLAEAYAVKGDKTQAREHYKHALSLAPPDQKQRIEGILAGL
jgi:tetratricopeptide (TPR) repeat protein